MSAVAKAAGVSVSTASHVVNGTRLVAPGTRNRVIHAMDLLGYEHHAAARSLSAGSNRTIGLALTAASTPTGRSLSRESTGRPHAPASTS